MENSRLQPAFYSAPGVLFPFPAGVSCGLGCLLTQPAAAENDLELGVLPPPAHKCWDYRWYLWQSCPGTIHSLPILSPVPSINFRRPTVSSFSQQNL